MKTWPLEPQKATIYLKDRLEETWDSLAAPTWLPENNSKAYILLMPGQCHHLRKAVLKNGTETEQTKVKSFLIDSNLFSSSFICHAW